MKISDAQLLEKIKTTVRALDDRAEVVLYGSRARGDARDESDWDILILVDGPADLEIERAFRDRLFDVELAYEVAISTTVHSKSEWTSQGYVSPLFQRIREEGVSI